MSTLLLLRLAQRLVSTLRSARRVVSDGHDGFRLAVPLHETLEAWPIQYYNWNNNTLSLSVSSSVRAIQALQLQISRRASHCGGVDEAHSSKIQHDHSQPCSSHGLTSGSFDLRRQRVVERSLWLCTQVRER